MFCADSYNVRIAFFGTVEDQTVVQVNKTAAKSEFLRQKFNRNKRIIQVKARSAERIVQSLYVHGKHEKLTSFRCKQKSNERRP